MDLFVFLTSFLLLWVVAILFRKSKRGKLPPGPIPLPIIGNLHQVAGPLPHQILTNMAKKYGPLMYLKLGEVSTVVVSSAEHAEKVMKDHDVIFASRPRFLFSTILNYNCEDITFSVYNDSWRQLRKICNIEVLNARRVQSFRPIREAEVMNLMKSLASQNGSVINMTRTLFSLTYAIIARSAFGKRSKHHDQYITLMLEVTRVMGAFNIVDWYPSIKILERITGIKNRLEKMQKGIDEALQTIIDDHKQKRAAPKTGNEEEKEDLVDVLLNIQESKGHGVSLSDNNVKGAVYDVFSGGGETSSRTLNWTMVEMIRNPAMMKRAQEEVRTLVGPRGNVNESHISELKYIRAVLKEVLRFHPAGPLSVPRESSEDCEIGGYLIPVKSRVIINLSAISRDPKHWTDPDTFNPDRFINSDIDFQGKNFSYIPFGGGRRICPGIAVAMSNLELPFAQMMYHFDWKLAGDMKPEEMDMTESFGLTVGLKNDLMLVPTLYHLSSLA